MPYAQPLYKIGQCVVVVAANVTHQTAEFEQAVVASAFYYTGRGWEYHLRCDCGVLTDVAEVDIAGVVA